VVADSRRARRRTFVNLLLASASIVVAVACIELFTFFVLDMRLPTYGQARFFQYSPLTGFAHAPNVEGTWYRYEDGTRFHVRTNGFGYPDFERSLTKRQPRIALIGDSTTEHWEAAEEDRPQVVLGELLGGRFEVLNQGARAFGTDQTYLLFKEVGVHFAPDIVVYTFCINDFWDNAQTDRKPSFVLDGSEPRQLRLRGYPYSMPPPAPKSWREPLKQSFVARRLYILAQRWLSQPTPLSEHLELRPYLVDYEAVDVARRDLTLAILDELSRFVRSHGMRFLIVETVYRFAYDDAGRAEVRRLYGDVFDFDKVSGLLADFAEAREIPFISLQKRWRPRGLAVGEIMHPEDNLHLNGRGARLFARELAEELESLGWLDELPSGAPR
jgi:lysophospholipase L1-like esterase